MNKYQKIIDYDKNEAHYFYNDNGIAMEVSKDIIIDELQERINKAIEYISNACNWLNIGFRDDDELLQVKAKFFKEISQILQGEDK